jgi:predicted glycosyltransferase
VHSDPTFLPFAYCWGSQPAFAAKIIHTGYVVDRGEMAPAGNLRNAPVVCSIGGGKDGAATLQLFLQAWDLLYRARALPADAQGVVFPGQSYAGSDRESLLREYEHLFANPADGLRIGSWQEYRQVLPRGRASVSMCGYNTCYEVLSHGVPALFVPRTGVEQTTRARLHQERGWAQVVANPQQLADALVLQWSSNAARVVPPLDFNGASRTARLLGEDLSRQRQRLE